MRKLTIKLTGWQTAGVLGLLLAFAVGHQVFIRRQLDAQAIETIKPFIAGAIVMDSVSEFAERDWGQLSEAEQQRLSDTAVAMRKLEVNLVSARGFGSDVVVKVDVTVDGQPPPDGKRERYFRLSYSYFMGWTMRQEVGAFSYWMMLW